MTVQNEPGISTLRRAMLLYMVGVVILSVGLLASNGYASQVKDHVSSASPIIPLVVLGVGVAIVLMSSSNVYRGFRIMHSVDRSFKESYEIGRYGAAVQFLASLLLSLGVYLIIFSNSKSLELIGPGFTLAGYVLGFLGALPVSLAFYRTGEKYKVNLVRLGGAIYFLIPFVSQLLLYIGLGQIVGEYVF